MRSILLATDGSPSAAEATRVAIDLAAQLDAEIVVACAEEFGLPYHDGYSFVDSEKMRSAEIERVDAALAAVDAAATQRGVRCTLVHLIGSPAEEICNEARSSHSEMIVIGTHGWGAVNRFLHGSVSTEVVHRAGCPVLVVRDVADDDGEAKRERAKHDDGTRLPR